jgi:predicted amidohydrolase
MARSITVATTSMATLEDYAPPYNLRPPDPADNLKLGLAMLDAAGQQKPDLAVLPETFMAAGLSSHSIRSVAQPIPGPAFDAVADCARRHAMNVVAGFFISDSDGVSNVAALIDRSGKLAGIYSKTHPTEGEIEGGVTPGPGARVFDTDFGRLGLAICFDINWPSLWSAMKRGGADAVCWISAYEGGLPLQAQASLHEVPIISSVWPYHARVIDRTGRILAQTSRWSRLAVQRLSLNKRVFHTDQQAHFLLPIQVRYGDRVRVESFTEEHIFTIESLSPDLEVDEVIREFGLVEFNAYLQRCERRQDKARGKTKDNTSPELAEI